MLEKLASDRLRGLVVELKTRGDFRPEGFATLGTSTGIVFLFAVLLIGAALWIWHLHMSLLLLALGLVLLFCIPSQIRHSCNKVIVPYSAGTLTKGTITKVWRESPFLQVSAGWEVSYEFEDQNGNRHTGKALAVPKDPARRMRAEPKEFHVLYDPKDPSKRHQILVETWFERGCVSQVQYNSIRPVIDAQRALAS